MQEVRKRILIVENDQDMAELLEAILGESYEGHTVRGRDVFEEVGETRPDLLIVDIAPHIPDAYQLLDALRVNRATRHIPVLVTTTLEPLAAAATASYNVRGALRKPFDLDELFTMVYEGLQQPPLHASLAPDIEPPTDILTTSERILAQHSREALLHWVQQLQRHPPWKGRSDLRLLDVLNHVPILVEALDTALHYDSPDALFERHPETAQLVRHHARLRQQQQIPLANLIREYTLLRDGLWDMLWTYLPRTLSTDDVRMLRRTVDGTLDRIVELTIPSYLQAASESSIGNGSK